MGNHHRARAIEIAVSGKQRNLFPVKTINEESGKKRGEIMQKMRGASEDQRKEFTTQVAGLRKEAEAEAAVAGAAKTTTISHLFLCFCRVDFIPYDKNVWLVLVLCHS